MASYRKPLSERNYASNTKKAPKAKKSRFNKEQILQDFKSVTAQNPSAISICENDLTSPTADRIQQIYLTVLNCLLVDSVDCFKQSAFMSQSFEHPELLDDVTYRLQFFRVMKKLMHACCVYDFGMNDIFNPDSKRTCRNLGSLFNYLRFEINVFNGQDTIGVVKDETERLKEEWSALEADNKESRHTLRELEKQKNEEKELDQELRQALVAQQQETHQLQLHHDAALKEYHSILEVFSKTEQKLIAKNKELEQWTQRNDDLRAQIVTSPDKLKAAQTQLESQVQDARVMKDETKSLLIMWESIVSNAHHVPPVIDGLNEDLGLLSAKVANTSQLEAKLVSIEEQLGRQKQVLREATAKHQNLLRHLKLIEDEANHAAYEGQHKLPHLNALDSLQRDVCLLQQQQKDKEKADAEIEKETVAIRAKITSIRERYERDCEELSRGESQLQAALQSQMKKYFELAKTITGKSPPDI